MSFMKKVAKIAAPFASFIPGVGPLISAGLGLVGSIPSKSKGKNQQPQSIFSDPAFMGALTNAQKSGQQLMDTGAPLVGQGTGYLNQAGTYFGDMLKGGSSLDKALAGPIADVNTGYNSRLQAMSKFIPRGNIAGSMMDHTARRGSDIARLRYDTQAGAGSNLAGVGNSLLSGGSNLMSRGASSHQDILNTLLGKMGLQNQDAMAAAGRKADAMGGLGEGVGSLLGILLGPGGLLNKGKSGSSSGSTGSVGGGGSWGWGDIFSDAQLKTNLMPLANVGGVQWYRFQWKPAAAKLGLSGWSTGVIAQEVQRSHPELVGSRAGYLTVNYLGLGGME